MDPFVLTLAVVAGCSIALAAFLQWRLQRSSRSNGALEAIVERLTLDGEKHDETAAAVGDLRVANAELQQQLATARQTAERAVEHSADLEGQKTELQSKLNAAEVNESTALATVDALQKKIDNGDELLELAKDSMPAAAAAILSRERDTLTRNAGESLKASEMAVKQLVDPLSDHVQALQGEIERLKTATNESSHQTKTLSDALTFRPNVRGELGQRSLQRVLELGGLTSGIDIFPQSQQDGKRPDYLVRLPNERFIFLDAKMVLKSIMDYRKAESEEERNKYRSNFRKSMREQIVTLGERRYGDLSKHAVDYVFMVVSDAAYQFVADHFPDLFELAQENQIVISNFTMLIPFIELVKLSLQGEKLKSNVEHILALSKGIYDDVARFAKPFSKLGKGLGGVLASFNESAGVFNGRLVSNAEELRQLGASTSVRAKETKRVDEWVQDVRDVPESGLGIGLTAETAINAKGNPDADPDRSSRKGDAPSANGDAPQLEAVELASTIGHLVGATAGESTHASFGPGNSDKSDDELPSSP